MIKSLFRFTSIALGLFLVIPAMACGDLDLACKQREGQLNLSIPTPRLPSIDPECRGDLCRFGKDAARELGKTPQAIQECFGNIQRCTNEILSAPLAIYAQAYLDGLYKQSAGRTRSFSPEFVAIAQPHYEIDLRGITYADDINTGHGMTVAYCDRIFFAGHGNLWQDRNELHHVLHELEHTVQCQRRGQRTYLAEYILKAAADVAKTGRVNVHDIHDFEVAADAKANQITDMLWNKIQLRSVPIPGASPAPPQTGWPNQPPASCMQGEVYMPSPGGACCTPNYSRCRNLTTGAITCGAYGC